ncbi:MAG: hypothetical protein RLY69_12 [Verrucomicrobiota bacterium]
MFEVFCARHASELKRHANIAADEFLKLFKLALGIDEVLGDVVGKERLAGRFEFADLLRTEFDAGVLLVVEFLAALVDALVLESGGVVVEKFFDLVVQLDHGWIAGDVLAEFAGFDDQGGVVGGNGHGADLNPMAADVHGDLPLAFCEFADWCFRRDKAPHRGFDFVEFPNRHGH